MKLCTVFGVVNSRAGSRCTEHARQSDRSRHIAPYSTRAWQRLSARVLRAWRGEPGDWCPGYGRPAHPSADVPRMGRPQGPSACCMWPMWQLPPGTAWSIWRIALGIGLTL